MKVRAHFQGGPLGGEVREIEYTGMRFQVPGLSYTGSYIQPSMALPETLNTAEEYIITPNRSQSDADAAPSRLPPQVDALWVHPNAKLIKENEELRRRIAELGKLDEALRALETLREFVGKL